MLGDLVKSGTWAMVQMAVGFAAGFALTGSAGIAAGVAVLGSCLGSFGYLLHERIWKTITHARR